MPFVLKGLHDQGGFAAQELRRENYYEMKRKRNSLDHRLLCQCCNAQTNSIQSTSSFVMTRMTLMHPQLLRRSVTASYVIVLKTQLPVVPLFAYKLYLGQ